MNNSQPFGHTTNIKILGGDKMTKNYLIRGNIYIVDLPVNTTHVQYGVRPCILLNANSVICTIIPLTTKINKLDKNKSHIAIVTYDKRGNKYNSLALLEQVQTVPISYIKAFYGKIDTKDKNELNNKIIQSYCIA